MMMMKMMMMLMVMMMMGRHLDGEGIEVVEHDVVGFGQKGWFNLV